ncbi:MAG TPA: hypothetical protein VNK44_01535 [Candidatus Nitrosotenuis sp.]|nr:hypothetical protein [Candidatus Nitrosotenuis sp.]
MKIIDVANQQRVNRQPDDTITLLDGGNFVEQGFTIKKITLRLFVEKTDPKLGPYSLITVLVETDKGSIEMVYDEGFRGQNALKRTADFVLNNLGLSAIILRSVVALDSKSKSAT